MFGISSKLKTSKYLSHVWILELQSGICLLERQYTPNSIDADLVSGFLTAMRNFGEEIAHSLMEEISFQNMIFEIALGKHIMVVCALTEDAPNGGAKGLLDIITFEFEMQFGDKLSPFGGNCSVFLPFGEFLDKLLNKNPTIENKSQEKDDMEYKNSSSVLETEKKKEALMTGLKHRMEERQRGSMLTNYVRRKVKEQYELEIASPQKLIQIHKNREWMRHERHLAIEVQTRLTQQIVQKELNYLQTFPLSRVQNLVGVRVYEDNKMKIKQNKNRKKKIQKLTKKIQKLQNELNRLN